jgi:hypothetical protein
MQSFTCIFVEHGTAVSVYHTKSACVPSVTFKLQTDIHKMLHEVDAIKAQLRAMSPISLPQADTNILKESNASTVPCVTSKFCVTDV